MGCAAKILRREMEHHLQSTVRLHLDLACVKLNDTHVQLSNTQKELKKTTRKLEKLEQNFSALENTLSQSSGENIYNWKINNFSQVLRQAKSGETTEIESAPFYRHGYKCQLSLNPNGYGDGENTHLSIFFHVMKGEYDAMLSWPFHKMITFTLIDQQENPSDRENISGSFTSETIARPVKDEGIGEGYHEFISHDKLKKRRYIVDDTAFIQMQVSPL